MSEPGRATAVQAADKPGGIAMKFLCLGYYDADTMDARPASEIEAIMDQCTPHLRAFYATGQVVVDAGLEPSAKRLRHADGKVEVADGRVADQGLLIGSATIIEARDMDDAIAVASRHPTPQVPAGAAFGWTIEIRPIHSFHQP
jgi:hypothetical protein